MFKADAGELVRSVPSFVVTAMVKGLASGQCSRLLQSCLLKALLHITRLLVRAGEAANRLPTPSKVRARSSAYLGSCLPPVLQGPLVVVKL